MPDDTLLRPDARAFRRDPPGTIGTFEVRAASNELVGPQGVIRLRPRLMDVLLRLAAAPGDVVPRQVLLDDVWPRRLVADEVLSRTIAELRTALADDAREARYIETLPKVGYRLIAPVAARVTPARAAIAQAPPSNRPPLRATLDAGEAALGRGSTTARTRGLIAAAAVAITAVIVVTAYTLRPANSSAAAAAALAQQLNTANAFSSELAMETGPRFSPDATRIAFALGDTEHAQIVVQVVNTRARTILGDPAGLRIAPVFFPDGERLAYYRREDKACAIVERSIASAAERVLVDCTQSPAPRFDLSPDGKRLVFASFGEGHTGLRLVDLATGRMSVLTSAGGAAGNDLMPRFSPDGTQVAFVRGLLGFREVWVVPVDDPGKAHAIGSPRGLTWGLAWMGNAGPLLVSADWPGSRALNVLDLATGKATLAGARGAQFPDISSRGDVVYEAAAYQSNLQLLDTADAARAPQTLWPSAKYSNYPQFSPDGSRVVFSSNRDNVSSLFVGTPGGDARRLPLPVDNVYFQAHWAHDGRSLYAVEWRPASGDGSMRGVRIDPASASIERFDVLGEGVSDLRDDAQGRTLYFATQEGPLMQLWRAPADAPERRERLALPKVLDYDLRNDRLVYAQPQQSDLTVCELPELRCAAAGLPEHEGRTGFALGRDALWVGYYGEPGELVRFDLASRTVTQRFAHGPSAVGINLAISPDERHALIARQEPPAIDLMLASRPR